MTSTSLQYHPVSRMFHWAIVALILVEYPIAWLMPDVRRDTLPDGLIAWHIGVGTLILTLMVLRVAARLIFPPPAELSMPVWQARAAKLVHGLLYLGFIALPVLGWINASSRDWTVHWVGLFGLPPLAPAGAGWAHEMGDVHQAVAIGLLVLIGLHVAATAYHEVILRDGALRRMTGRARG